MWLLVVIFLNIPSSHVVEKYVSYAACKDALVYVTKGMAESYPDEINVTFRLECRVAGT